VAVDRPRMVRQGPRDNRVCPEATVSPADPVNPDKTPSRCPTQCPPQSLARPANRRTTANLDHQAHQASQETPEPPAHPEPVDVAHNRSPSKGSAAAPTTTPTLRRPFPLPFATVPPSESTSARRQTASAKDPQARPVPLDPTDSPETPEALDSLAHPVPSWMDPRWLAPLDQWDRQDPLEDPEMPEPLDHLETRAPRDSPETWEPPGHLETQEDQDTLENPAATEELALATTARPHAPPPDTKRREQQREDQIKIKNYEENFIAKRNYLSAGLHCDLEFFTLIVFVLLISKRNKGDFPPELNKAQA